MGKINVGRMVVGGLIAGVVLNVCEWIINELIMGDSWSAWMADHSFATEPTVGQIVFWILFMFVVGIFAVWFYTAIRPRYSAGPMTALCAGLAVWFAAVFVPWFGMAVGGMAPFGMTIWYLILALIEYLLATYLGAWYYREEEAGPAVAAEPPTGE